MVIISLPQLRQTYGYDCGAKALQSVLVYYGFEVREDELMKLAGTSPTGTPIKGIVKAAKKYGLKVDSKPMTCEEVKGYIKRRIPVIILLQAWTEKKQVKWESDWVDGHYVVAIGYTKDRVLFEDPSSFERTYLRYNELEKRWHDVDERSGKKYFHQGIALFGKKPLFDSKRVVHMG